MLTELLGKGGKLCQPALEGKLRCPLIVRPNAEDVVTGNVMSVLQVLQARWWLPDLFNVALGATRFELYFDEQCNSYRARPGFRFTAAASADAPRA